MLGYRRYMNALLYAGVTTVLDTGNVQPYIVQLRAETAAGRLLGPHIYCVGGLVDGADPAWPPLSYAVASVGQVAPVVKDRKSTRLNSSHSQISYAVFCLTKQNTIGDLQLQQTPSEDTQRFMNRIILHKEPTCCPDCRCSSPFHDAIVRIHTLRLKQGLSV